MRLTETGGLPYVSIDNTGHFKLPSSDLGPTTTAGYIRHDSSVTNYEAGGALIWYDGDELRYIVDIDTAPSTSNFVLFYDEGNDKFESRVLTSDLVEDGTNLGISTTFSEFGTHAGDANEICNESSPTIDGDGELCINETDETVEFWDGSAKAILDPHRESFVSCINVATSLLASGGNYYVNPLGQGYLTNTTEVYRTATSTKSFACGGVSMCHGVELGASEGVIVKLRKNAADPSPNLTCTSDGDTSGSNCSAADDSWGCSDSSQTVSYSAGDRVSMHLTCTGANCPLANPSWTTICVHCWTTG
jgi:hypothetical protein